PSISEGNPKSLAHLYDVNAGSNLTRSAFERFIEVSEWAKLAQLRHRPHEAFYWEHRMGIWGASALAESDMAFRGIPAYNSRHVFEVFLGLSAEHDRRQLFEKAISELAPSLDQVGYES